jgi:hypothetical protein
MMVADTSPGGVILTTRAWVLGLRGTLVPAGDARIRQCVQGPAVLRVRVATRRRWIVLRLRGCPKGAASTEVTRVKAAAGGRGGQVGEHRCLPPSGTGASVRAELVVAACGPK